VVDDPENEMNIQLTHRILKQVENDRKLIDQNDKEESQSEDS
jgi:hypothetical protein